MFYTFNTAVHLVHRLTHNISSLTADIVMIEHVLSVFRLGSDTFFYVVGSVEEVNVVGDLPLTIA